MTIGFRIMTIAAALTLGGCGLVSVDDAPAPRHSYFDGDFEYAAHKGAVLAEIAGNPFGMPPESFQTIVIDRMQGQTRASPGGHFVTAPNDQTIAPYKVVVAFNMPPNVDGHVLCRGTSNLPPPVQNGVNLTLDMAFCFGDGLKTDAKGRVAGVTGVDDPKFTELVRRVAYAMLPARDGMDRFGGGNGVP